MTKSKCLNQDVTSQNAQSTHKKWSDLEDEQLLLLAAKNKGHNWKAVALEMAQKSSTQCRSRYYRVKEGIKRGRWTLQEEQKLRESLDKLGIKDYSRLAKCMGNRNPKQVREKLINNRHEGRQRNEFSGKDKQRLLKAVKDNGTKWKKIARLYFPQKTNDYLKNRYYAILKSIAKEKTKPSEVLKQNSADVDEEKYGISNMNFKENDLEQIFEEFDKSFLKKLGIFYYLSLENFKPINFIQPDSSHNELPDLFATPFV